MPGSQQAAKNALDGPAECLGSHFSTCVIMAPFFVYLQRGGSGIGGFNWDDVVSSGARSRQAAEEAFYGFGDFFRDLDRDRYSAAPSLSTVCAASGLRAL